MRISTFQRWLIVLLAVGLVARLLVVHQRLHRPLQGDELSYDSIAINVASGYGYVSGSTPADMRPTAVRGPGYVLFLAAFYRLFDHHTLPPLVAQAFLDILSAWLLARLALRWFGDPRVALGAVALYVIYPPFVLNTAQLMTETTSQLAIVACVYLYFEYLHTRRLAPLLGSGAALGLCALSKPQLAPIGIVLGIASIGAIPWRQAARAAATVTVVVGLVLAPWIVRNALVFHAFIPGVSIGGLALWLGAGPYGGKVVGGITAPEVPDSVRALLAPMSEMEFNRWTTQEGKRVIAADPARYVRLAFKKILPLWFNLGYDGERPSRASWLVAAFNAAMIGLAIIGARGAHPAPPASAAMVGLALFWTLVHAPFFAVLRYTFPYYALLFAFSAAGLVVLARRARPAAEPVRSR